MAEAVQKARAAAADYTSKYDDALLCYDIYDEPTPVETGWYGSVAQALRQADPYHPITGVNNAHFAPFSGMVDVMSVDAYPITSDQSTFDVLIQRMTEARRDFKGPIWYCAQAFPWGGYYGGPFKNNRYPTYDEERSLSYLSFVLGANGIYYWSRSSCGMPDAEYAYPILWRSVFATAREIADLRDVLLAKPWPQKVHAGQAAVRLMAKQYKGDLYLVAVNTRLTKINADFSVAGLSAARVTVLGEGRRLDVQGGRFADTFEPKTTHVYTTCAAPPSVPDVTRTRAEIARLEHEREALVCRDIACVDTGAKVTVSFRPASLAHRSAALRFWDHIADGFPGSYFEVNGGIGQHVDIAFARPRTVSEVVVTTSANLGCEVSLRQGDQWTKIATVPKLTTGQPFRPGVSVATARYTFPPVIAAGVRLSLVKRAGEGELRVYEVEALDSASAQ